MEITTDLGKCLYCDAPAVHPSEIKSYPEMALCDACNDKANHRLMLAICGSEEGIIKAGQKIKERIFKEQYEKYGGFCGKCGEPIPEFHPKMPEPCRNLCKCTAQSRGGDA